MLLSVLLPAPDVRPAPAARPLSRRPRRSLRWVEGVSVWLVMLLLLFVHPLYAEAADEPRPETGASFHFLSADGRWQAPAMVLTTDYRVTVTGLVAQTRLRQEFANTGREWREGVFVFPLPADASVHGLTMVAGERRIVGEIQSREMAQRAYEAARDHGQQAARVDQQRPNLFTTRLANIPPGESVTVELQYQQLVRYQSGEFELRLPTTLTPRYMPGRPASNPSRQWQEGWAVATTEVADAERISPFTVATADVADASHRARVAVTVNAGLPVARVTSPSHALTTTWNGSAVTVTPTEELVTMDRDFVLRWQPVRGAEPAAAVFRETWQGEEYLLAMLVPGLDNGQWLARELVFVIDTSGSMAGESIRQARAALLEGLATLTPDDRFNVIRFDSETRSLFIDSVAASANNLARARRYVMALEADGGTEMAPALDAALGSEGTPGLVRQVVFITDGAVGNEAALFARIRNQLGNSRLFTVGIGSAPNMHFMREAARYGRGTYTAISDLATLAEPLAGLFGKMKAPVLTDLQVQWPGADSGEAVFPRRPGDLFAGEPLLQLAKDKGASGELIVSGRLPDGSQWQQPLDLDQAAPGSGLHRLWARHKVDSLQDQNFDGQVSDAVRREITGIAVRHQLMTRYTSLVAVDKTPARPLEEDLVAESVPTLLPAGSTTGMLRYPATATAAPLLIGLGLTGLMFALAATMLRRRVFQ